MLRVDFLAGFVTAAALLCFACKKDPSQRDIAAARSWSTPHAVPSTVVDNNPSAAAGDPHAGMKVLGRGNPHVGMDRSGDPAMAQFEAPDPKRAIDRKNFVRGRVVAAKDLRSRIASGSILFLSVKPYDPATGEILGTSLAVERIDVNTLPIFFELTDEHAMVAGTKLSGDVLILARIDQDGEARSKQPGDIEGTLVARIPAKDLKLTLDTVVAK